MSKEPDPDRLAALDAKIQAAKGAEAKPHMEEHYSQAQHAWRMVTEMVSGLGIGFGIGYGLDALLGSSPWMMLVFTLLGFVAGVKVMIRSAQELQEKQMAADAADGNEGT